MTADWVSAAIAGGTLIFSVMGSAIVYGALKQKVEDLIARVTSNESEIKSVNALGTNVAVMKAELDHVRHDVRNIEQSMRTVERFVLSGGKDGA